MYQISETFNISGCRDMDKRHQKYSQNRVFLHLWPQNFFLQKSGSVTFVLLWYPNFMQKIRKTNERSLRFLKTDTHTQGQLLRTRRVNSRSNIKYSIGVITVAFGKLIIFQIEIAFVEQCWKSIQTQDFQSNFFK